MPDELLVLGSASADPTQRRFASAYALNVTGKLFLIDCGAPVSTLLPYYGFNPVDIQALFLSHWQMDHIANLGLFLTQNHQRKRTKPLKVYGPQGSRGKIRRLLSDSFVLPENLSYKLKVRPIKTAKSYKEALLRVTYFKTQQLEQADLKAKFGSKAVAYGMVLNGPGWRVVYSGDLSDPAELIPHLKECQLLIYELAHHTPKTIARFAQAQKIPHLLISHISPEFDESPQKIRASFAKHYRGNLIFAADGLKISLSNLSKNSEQPIIELVQETSLPEGNEATTPLDQQEGSPNATFFHVLQEKFNLPPAQANQILQSAKEILVGQSSSRQVGQVGVVVANLNATSNAPLTQMDRIEVTLTLDAGHEDTEVELNQGLTGLRRGRIIRLTAEAIEQDGILTQEDLAWILNVNVRTIRRDINILKQKDHIIYTRGQVKTQDTIQLYQARAVEQWLGDKSIEDIAAWLHHAPQAVERYINQFLDIATLSQQNHTPAEILIQTQTSAQLIQDYVGVYQQAQKKPSWKNKLEQKLINKEGDADDEKIT